MNLSENLKKIRKENHLSQEQLAEKLGVSRQAVSKWESNQAYPEMDKVLQLAQMFHLNIDDLFHQDIGEVNREKQSKTTMNKYIDDFLSFVTKTVDMFSNMRWRDRIKCILEQIFIVCCFIGILWIVASIGDNILAGLISMLPQHVGVVIHSIFESIYFIISFIFIMIILVHIFKTRYLDYYVIVREENSVEKEEFKQSEEEMMLEVVEENKENTKKYIKKKEKIVIRDPKHSEYRFISGMMKVLLWCIKGIVFLFAGSLCFLLIGLIIALVMSCLIMKTGLFFAGIFIAFLAGIVMTLLLLIIAFNFIMNRKNRKKMILATLILSIILMGFGSGIAMIGFTQFDYIDDISNPIYQEDELLFPMQDDLIIYENYYGNDSITYIEENREDIRVVYQHTKYFELTYQTHNSNELELYFRNTNPNILEIVRDWLQDINHRKIIHYGKVRFYVYTSKENIEKLKQNWKKHYEEQKNIYSDYHRVYEQNVEYENKIYEYEAEIRNLEGEIEELKERIDSYEVQD